jgi:glycosyltransferase involved in cell wall biosynthesis
MENKPLVSIVITSYNRAHWIGKTIESALAQDYENLEIVISDNASTDNSDEVIKKYAHDKRVKYSRNPSNIGMLPNFRKVFFELSQGKYIINISSDDYLTCNTFVSSAIELTNRYEKVLLVFGKYQNHFVDKIQAGPVPFYYETEFRKGLEVFYDFPKYPFFGWGGCMLNREVLSKPNIGISDSVTCDIEANLKIMQYGNVGFVNDDVYAIRIHDRNAASQTRSAKEYIKGRLDMFEGIYNNYKLVRTDRLDELEKWRWSMLQKDIEDILRVLCFKNHPEFLIFEQYVAERYPEMFLPIDQSIKYKALKWIFAPFIRKTGLFDILNKVRKTWIQY